MSRLLIITGLLTLATRISLGQAVYTPADVQIWEQKFVRAEAGTAPISEQIIHAGKGFLGTPYEARTLENTPEEQLIVYFKGLDCTTFVENSLAIALTSAQNDYSFDTYTQTLQRIRYRGGRLNAYPSRLHYFSDWLYDNEQKGLIEEITQRVGGKPLVKTINFMSTHRSSYAQLANDTYWQAIQQHEKAINERPHYYIPKNEVTRMENQLADGDIIAITTGIAGLDIVHVGLAVRQNGRIHLMHASTDEKRVVISKQPLADYLLAHKTQTGIRVARVK
jgi:hypothetical protein